jgi:hypothetical protein
MNRDTTVRTAITALAWVWAGMAAGVSFIAAPAKFQAPSLTLPVALDVGHHVFWTFHTIQLGLTVVAVGLASMSQNKKLRGIIAVVVVLFLAQHLYLLPQLDVQTAAVQAGGSQARTALHVAYAGAEVVKVIALFALGWISLRMKPADLAPSAHGERSGA